MRKKILTKKERKKKEIKFDKTITFFVSGGQLKKIRELSEKTRVPKSAYYREAIEMLFERYLGLSHKRDYAI